MAQAVAEVTITIQGQAILNDLKKVLKEIKRERQRIERIIKEAS